MRCRCTLVVGVAFFLAQFGLIGLKTASAQNMGFIDSNTADKVLPYGEMSLGAYGVSVDTPGWTRVADWQQIFVAQGRSDQINAAAASGFSATVYQNAIGNITIAYRGTVDLFGPTARSDVQAANGQTPAQYAYAQELAILVQRNFPNAIVTVTGHSSGGGQATYAAQQVPGISQVITFNAASPGILSSVTRAGTSQINVVVPGDVVGDPKAGSVVGLGSLPGKLYYVNSTTYNQQDSLSRTEGIWRPQDSHSMEGIVGGLNQVANSSPSSTAKPASSALPQSQTSLPASRNIQSPTSAGSSWAPSDSASISSGLIKSTNPDLQMYSFKQLSNGNVEIYENGKPISSGGGFSPSYAQGLGYSPPLSQSGPAQSAYTFTPTQYGTIQIAQNGKIIATTTPQLATQQYGYQAPNTQTPSLKATQTPTTPPIAVTAPSQSVPHSATTGTPAASATAVDVGRPAPLPEVIAHPIYSTAPNATSGTPLPTPSASPNTGPVPSTAATSQPMSSPFSQSPAPAQSTSVGPFQPAMPPSQPVPTPSSSAVPTQPAAGAVVQPAQLNTKLALQTPSSGPAVQPAPSLSAASPTLATRAAAVPGGISLSRAAAQQMPLGIALDASYFDGEKIVLSGKEGKIGIDAALFLTALRTACEDREPYFSLDPDDGALWSTQGQQAFEMLWKRIEGDLSPRAFNRKERIGASLDIRTVSARRDYAKIWSEIAPNFPGLRAKLVFYPEWLRQTRFGKVLYEADVLLKELSSGIPVLSARELRAGLVKGYLAADAERAAKSLLSGRDNKHSMTQWRGSRLWFDIVRSPPAAGLEVEQRASDFPCGGRSNNGNAQGSWTNSGHGRYIQKYNCGTKGSQRIRFIPFHSPDVRQAT